MRYLKNRGGLTRSSGFSEIQRSTWLLSMEICSNYNLMIQEFSKVSFITSDQHKDTVESRITKDNNDYHKVLEKLSVISLFQPNVLQLMNICSGFTANSDVNFHMMYDIRENILEKIIEKPIFFY